jgi:hypothetical protein
MSAFDKDDKADEWTRDLETVRKYSPEMYRHIVGLIRSTVGLIKASAKAAKNT